MVLPWLQSQDVQTYCMPEREKIQKCSTDCTSDHHVSVHAMFLVVLSAPTLPLVVVHFHRQLGHGGGIWVAEAMIKEGRILFYILLHRHSCNTFIFTWMATVLTRQPSSLVTGMEKLGFVDSLSNSRLGVFECSFYYTLKVLHYTLYVFEKSFVENNVAEAKGMK